MGVEIHKPGVAYAKNLARRGKIDRDSAWTFGNEDSARLLGADGNDLQLFGKFHMGTRSDASADPRGRFSFPFGKNGKVFRQAVVDAKAQAAKDGLDEIEDAAAAILEIIDGSQGHIDGAETTKSVSRVDSYDYREWYTTPMERTDEGFLKGRAVVTNIGVFPYMNPDGTMRYELRHPDEVFHPDSLASLDGKPLTNDHPMSGVDPRTAQDLAVGTVTSPGTDAYHVFAKLTILRQDAIEAVGNGKTSLSCGYNCDLVPERGNFQGSQYTHKQTNIRYNHVALVEEGRAGDAAKLRMDGIMPVQVSTTKTPTKGEHMAKLRLDSGAEFEVPEAVASHVDALVSAKKTLETKVEGLDKERGDAVAKVTALEADVATKSAALDSAKTQVEDLTKKLDEAVAGVPAAIEAGVTSRVDLLAKATEIGAKVGDAKSDRDIQLAIIAMETADSMEGKPDAYITARADSAYEHLKNHKPADEPGGNSHTDGVLSGAASQLEAARRTREATLQNAWKGGKE